VKNRRKAHEHWGFADHAGTIAQFPFHPAVDGVHSIAGQEVKASSISLTQKTSRVKP
jgi:hypothetical protein